MNDSTFSAGALDCPLVVSVIDTLLVRFSSSIAPQLLQTKAVYAFSLLQIWQIFPEVFTFTSPKISLTR
jgi:hypothetical protein